MPRTCTVCRHPERPAINAALVAGEPLRDIAVRFGLSRSALDRHNGEHLPATLLRAKDAAEVAHADDLLGQVRGLGARALAILDQAEEAGERRTALAAIREARGVVELVARLVGELREQQVQVNVDGTEYVAVWGGGPLVLEEEQPAVPDMI